MAELVDILRMPISRDFPEKNFYVSRQNQFTDTPSKLEPHYASYHLGYKLCA